MKVYLVYTCKVRNCERSEITVESVWEDEVKAIEHARYWNENLKDWHFWIDEKELRK